MSPYNQFHDDNLTRREMNGQRPSPLKINKDSHLIHKPASSLSTSASTASSLFTAPTKQRHPVIIYTHSPKIIHTQARDFMALVQKLTGISQSDAPPAPEPQPTKPGSAPAPSDANRGSKLVGSDDLTSSPSVEVENHSVANIQVSSSSLSPAFNPSNSFFPDIPLFTPNSTDFFCSSRPHFRYPDSLFSSPNMGSSISPSAMDVLKAFPEY